MSNIGHIKTIVRASKSLVWCKGFMVQTPVHVISSEMCPERGRGPVCGLFITKDLFV